VSAPYPIETAPYIRGNDSKYQNEKLPLISENVIIEATKNNEPPILLNCCLNITPPNP
jgi:hypothetical protein